MARLIVMVMAIALATVLAAAIIFAPKPVLRQELHSRKPPVVSQTAAAVQSGAKTSSPARSASRDVGSGVVASLVEPGTVLERIAPAPLPAEAAEPVTEIVFHADAEMRWRVVFNSVITAAGVFELNGTTIVLPGIDVVAADEICTTNAGQNWRCGAAARTALRAHVRNRALNCHLPILRRDKAIVAQCLLQGSDPAQWLVAQGWARAAKGGGYEELETLARGSFKGIFGSPSGGIGTTAASGSRTLPEPDFDETTAR